MSEPFIGQVQIFGFGFPPRQWAQCSGQMLPLSQYTALFALLGVNFGGDGKTNFGLPDFGGRAGCAVGIGPGLSTRVLGESFGVNSVTLTDSEMAMHNHDFTVFNQRDPDKRHGTPVSGDALSVPGTITPFVADSAVSGQFPLATIGLGGGGLPHDNQQPYLTLNFCIALQGVFPQRP